MSLLLAAILLAMPTAKPPEPNTSSIRTMPVARTPEANTVILALAIPQSGEVIDSPAYIQFRIDGFALGAASSQFERADDLAISDMGQTIHVVIDDHPYFPINEPAIDPFDEAGWYYDTSYKFEVPFHLKNGVHTVRMFPARSFGESLKGENTFVARNFYVGSMKGGDGIDLSVPFITYNEPSNNMHLVQGKPVLLDFYLSNAELSADGYKVRLTIDGKINRVITSWQPYYIYGLKRGQHTIQLELLDSENKIVPCPFNKVAETITIH